eukprot:g3757.t1
MNVSSKATGDPPVVAAFCLGAYDSNFLLRFGMARRDDDRPAALDGRHFFELESLRIPLQLTPLASKHRGEFTYCTMRGAGRSTCRGCYFDQLDDPDAATSESCAKCAFVAGLEDVYSHLQDHDFLAEMERWLLGWRDPRGMRRRWLSLTLERSESALSCVAERVVSFVFPEGHPLDTIQAEDLRWEGQDVTRELPWQPVFVPEPYNDKEDAGVLMSFVRDQPTGNSFCIVLDAATMEEQARIHFPEGHHIPLHGHGTFIRA